MKLSEQCQERVTSVVDQMDGLRQEIHSSRVVSRDFVTHQALRDELGAVTTSAAAGHKMAEKVVGEVDRLRQDLENMKGLNLETMQGHPNIAGLQASEDREQQAYTRVLLRLEELVERLQTFENAAAGPGALTSSALTAKGPGIPAEFAASLGPLVDRIAEVNDVERQVESKFQTFGANMEALASPRRGEASSQLE